MHQALAALIAVSLTSCALAQEAPLMPPTSDPVSFSAVGEDAPGLEGVLSIPRRPDAQTRVSGVVVCHPNPMMGGTMNDPVMLEIEDRLLDLGIAVLRFNFRGTGASEGEHGAGEIEADDVLGAVAFLRAQEAVDAERVAVAGYSFGSLMAVQAAARDEAIAAVACIGFPTGQDLVRAADFPWLANLTRPFLFVTGTADEFSSVANIMALREHYALNARVLPIEGGDHFFTDAAMRSRMGIEVAQFLSVQLLGEL